MNEEAKTLADVCVECLATNTFGGSTEVSQDASSVFSSDAHYAPGDARVPQSIFGGVVTRNGLAGKKKRRKFVVRKNS